MKDKAKSKTTGLSNLAEPTLTEPSPEIFAITPQVQITQGSDGFTNKIR